MTNNLGNLVAIVVGASSGIGRASAASLARAGARVVAAARRTEALESLRQEAHTAGGTLAVETIDSGRRDDVDRLIAATLERFGRIDLLVYAAGTNIPARSLERLSPGDWDLLLATNLTGAFHCTQAVLPAMRAAGGGLLVY